MDLLKNGKRLIDNKMDKKQIIQEFLDNNREIIPGVYFVDFVYMPTGMFYRNIGFYYTLAEAIEKASAKICGKYKLIPTSLVYNSNLFLNSAMIFDKLVVRFIEENEDVGVSLAKQTNDLMKQLIAKKDLNEVQNSSLNDYQKKYVTDKINENK